MYNLEQNIYRLFNILPQFLFTTRKTELDFITRKWMYELPKSDESPNDLRLRVLGNFKKISEMLGFAGKYSADHPKAKFWRFW